MRKRHISSLSFPMVIAALLSQTHATRALLPSSSNYHHQRHYNRQVHNMVATTKRTQYTIDDSVCLPTRPHVLEGTVRKACASLETFLAMKPIAAHTQQAFDSLQALIRDDDTKASRPIILDSGCGTGRSSLLLGEMYPNHLVIGVDRSFVRLSKQQGIGSSLSDDASSASSSASKRPICECMADNVMLLRAELVDFWRCCLREEWNITHHYMLYPNPYPKQTRLTQRFYAHPSFPLILRLGANEMVIRSNWEGYLKEFAASVEIADEFYCQQESQPNYAEPYLLSAQEGPTLRKDKKVSMTNFERKYDAVGEPTYELRLVASTHSEEPMGSIDQN